MPLYKTIVKKVSIPQDKKVKQKNYEEVGQLAVVDQGKDIIGGYSNDFDKRIECDLPVVIFGDHTCTVKYINFPFAAGADGIKILESKDNVVPKYLYYGTKYLTLRFPEKGYARHYQHIEKMDLFLPTVSEQRRIVSRIEELFSKLDKGVETLQTIKQQLAVYRQAVLTEAFARIEEKRTIREMSVMVTSGSRGWAKYYADNGALFIRIGNLGHIGISICFDDVQCVDLPDKAEGIRSRLYKNDVLVSITADLGSIGYVPENIPEAYINQHIAMIRFKNPIQGKFMAWYLRSEYGQKDLLKNKRGGGKQGLGLDDIRNTRVPNVSNEYAEKIVQEIESRLSVCDSIEQTVAEALIQADAMRQSILKRAFEGKL